MAISLSPGRHVGAEDVEDEDEPFEQKIQRLMVQLEAQLDESEKLGELIRGNLRDLRHGS